MSIANLFVPNYFNLYDKTLTFRELTTTERLALTPNEGMICFDTTLHSFYFYQDGEWVNYLPGSTITRIVENSQCAGAYTGTISMVYTKINDICTVTCKGLTNQTFSAGLLEIDLPLGFRGTNPFESFTYIIVTDNGTNAAGYLGIGANTLQIGRNVSQVNTPFVGGSSNCGISPFSVTWHIV